MKRAKAELGSSNFVNAQAHRPMLDLISEAIVVHRNGRFLYLNPSAALLLGIRHPDEALGKDVVEVCPQFLGLVQDRAQVPRKASAHAMSREERLVRPDGEVIKVEAKDHEVAFAGQGATLVIIRDLAQHGKSEPELYNSEARYRAIIEDHLEFIVRWLPDGTRTFVNEAYCRFFGSTRQQMIGTSFLLLIVKEERHAILTRVKELSPRQPSTTEIRRVLCPDGSIGWQLWTDRGIFDQNGQLVELQSVGRDVTKRMMAERALRESEQRYRTLFENAPEAIVVLDVEKNRFCDANQNALTMFRLDRELLFQMSPIQLSPLHQPDGRSSNEVARQVIQRTLAGDTPLFEWSHLDARGKEIPCEVRLVRLPFEGRVLVRGSITDVTERRRLEEQLLQSQKMEAIGRLAGGVAHDFNNLLTAISGHAELASDRLRSDHPAVEDIHAIDKACERASSLTHQLLAFSRKQIIQPKVTDLNAIVRQCGEMLDRIIGENIHIHLDLEPDLHYFEADHSQIEQMILNLAVNARDAMPEGGTLTIRSWNTTLAEDDCVEQLDVQPGQYVVMEVIDTGSGMDPDTLTHVFDPFFTTKEKGKGTGLGLAMVYGTVKQSNGYIWAFSEAGKGTTFKACFPRSSKPLPKKVAKSHNSPRGKESILVVEDEEMVRGLAVLGLIRCGYTVAAAADAEDALQIAHDKSRPIDLVITDVVMPGMNGYEMMKQLTAFRPSAKALFVSGYADDSRIEQHLVQPGVAFLHKPFTLKELASKVRQVIDE